MEDFCFCLDPFPCKMIFRLFRFARGADRRLPAESPVADKPVAGKTVTLKKSGHSKQKLFKKELSLPQIGKRGGIDLVYGRLAYGREKRKTENLKKNEKN